MNKTSLVILLVISALLGSTAIAFSFAGEIRQESKADRTTLRAVALIVQGDGVRRFPDEQRIRPAALSGGLRAFLAIVGDRLEKPGKERVTYTGTLQRAGEDRASLFTLIWELPGRLRLEDHGRQQVTLFNGETVSRTESGSTTFDDELLETLVFDSAEHVFVSQMQGAGTRSLGSRFRLTEDSRAEYAGPVYDIFEVTEASAVRQGSIRQTRQYFFNSDTLVLESVKYRVSQNGIETAVEVRLENWQRADGQLFPRRIVRLENGTPVITLNISSILVSPWVDDGFFSAGVEAR